MSQKIQLKNILIGIAIGLGLIFLTLLILYFIYVFLPNQETIKMQKQVEEYEKLFWEHKKTQPLPEE